MESGLKWYQSKKFVTIIVAILAFVLNDKMGLNIDEEQLAGIVGLVITFILAQYGLDLKDRNEKKSSLQDPMVRDAIENLVSDFYDYQLARADGLSEHSLQVKEKVMAGLEIILDPKFQKDAKDISQEVIRIVMKMYKEDQSMAKGADVVMAALKKEEK